MHLPTSLSCTHQSLYSLLPVCVQNHVKSVLHVNLLYLYTYTFGYGQLYLRAVCVYETGKKTRSNLVPLFLENLAKVPFLCLLLWLLQTKSTGQSAWEIIDLHCIWTVIHLICLVCHDVDSSSNWQSFQIAFCTFFKITWIYFTAFQSLIYFNW